MFRIVTAVCALTTLAVAPLSAQHTLTAEEDSEGFLEAWRRAPEKARR